MQSTVFPSKTGNVVKSAYTSKCLKSNAFYSCPVVIITLLLLSLICMSEVCVLHKNFNSFPPYIYTKRVNPSFG